MLRLSSYFIVSARLSNGGYAVLNGLTGAMDLINEQLYRIFETMTQTGDAHALYLHEDDLPDDILDPFIRRGHITKLSHAEERERLEERAAALHASAAKRPAVVIVPDMDCNYRCVYCFEKDLQKNLNHIKTKMNAADIDAVYQSIDQIASEIGPIGNEITLFGGEPLCAANKAVIERIIEKGLARGLRFPAITNGHDLHEYLHLLGENKIASVQITIDGPQDIHDKRRIARDGNSSFERIIGNIHRALTATDVRIGIRVNLDETNYSAFGELLTIFRQEGLLDNDRFSVNAAIVYHHEQGGAVASYNINTVKAELSGLANAYKNVTIGCPQANTGSVAFMTLIDNQPYGLRSHFCAASSGMYIFLPDGTVACCWETLADERGRIGRYDQNGLVLDPIKTQMHFGRSSANIPECLDCKYCLVCAGGCAAYAMSRSNDLYTPYCGDFPETYAWVLAEAVEDYLQLNGF